MDNIHSSMLPAPSRSTRNARAGRQRGVTLIESALVISIIALIILAALLALQTWMAQERITQAVTDVTVIRSAVTRWTGGGFVTYPNPSAPVINGEPNPVKDPERSLTRWNQIGGLLPEPLRTLARQNGITTTLSRANPWDGEYRLATAGTSKPREWSLTVTKVPETYGEAFVNQLKAVGALRAEEVPGSEERDSDTQKLVVRVRVSFRD